MTRNLTIKDRRTLHQPHPSASPDSWKSRESDGSEPRREEDGDTRETRNEDWGGWGAGEYDLTTRVVGGEVRTPDRRGGPYGERRALSRPGRSWSGVKETRRTSPVVTTTLTYTRPLTRPYGHLHTDAHLHLVTYTHSYTHHAFTHLPTYPHVQYNSCFEKQIKPRQSSFSSGNK